MKRIIFIMSILAISVASLIAQDIVLEAEYPSVVQSGQQFTVTWTVNANNGDFTAPSLDGFYRLMGPSTSYSSSTQIINGKVTRNITNSFTYVLQAMDPGNYTIPGATYTIKNDVYRSDPLTIEVVAGNTAPPRGQTNTNNSQQNPATTRSNTSGSQVFLDFIVNKREVYVGEPILATAKIYTRVNLSGISDVKFPSFSGFMKTDLDTPPLNNLVEENVNGTVYGAGVLQQFLLYPQITGEIVIEPMSVTALQQQRVSTGRGFNSFFDSFFDDFFSSYQTVPIAVASDPITIKVKPLPGNRPSDFSGVVGKLEMRSSMDKDTVNVNDAITLSITVTGNGNLRIAATPELDLVPDIEQYDPKITDNIRSSSSGTSGSRTFEFLLIPRFYGDYTIPPVTYSYFDPSTGKYEKLSTPEYHFYANRVEDSSTGLMVYGGVSKEDVRYVGQDIRFIKNRPGRLQKTDRLMSESGSFYSLYGFALLLFLAILFIRREHVRRNSDITAVKNRRAGRVAVKRLKVASEWLAKNDMERFYEEVLKALWGYLGDKFSVPQSSLNKKAIMEILKSKGVDDNKIDELSQIIDTYEFARYAPSSSEAEASDLYARALGFINYLEGFVGR